MVVAAAAAAAAFDLRFGEEVGLWDVDLAFFGESLRIHTARRPWRAVHAYSELELGVVLWGHVGLLARSAGCEASQTQNLQKTAVAGLPGRRFSGLEFDAAVREPVAVADTSSSYTQAEEDSGLGLVANGLRISRSAAQQ